MSRCVMRGLRCAQLIANRYEGTEGTDGLDEAQYLGYESVKSRHYEYITEQGPADIGHNLWRG